jgi:organic hydroperoxide reductase OsmC/OhrA
MMGTLASLLAKKGIPTDESRYRASVEGDIEDVNGVLKITEIRVHYDITVPPGKRTEARQVFEQYLPHCPGAQSVIGCIQIKHNAQIKEQEQPA